MVSASISVLLIIVSLFRHQFFSDSTWVSQGPCSVSRMNALSSASYKPGSPPRSVSWLKKPSFGFLKSFHVFSSLFLLYSRSPNALNVASETPYGSHPLISFPWPLALWSPFHSVPLFVPSLYSPSVLCSAVMEHAGQPCPAFEPATLPCPQDRVQIA